MNPASFRPGQLWPDNHGVHINAHGGGILLHDQTYYWFGEHKIEGNAGNHAHVGVHVYSSQNLYHWTDRGIALPVSQDPNNDLGQGCILERPKVLYNALTKKFVMWFHLEPKGQGYSGARSGVAIADHPTGPFTYLESFRPNAGHWPLNVPPEARQALTDADAAFIRTLKLDGGPHPQYPTDKIFVRDLPTGQMARDMTLFLDDDLTAYHIYSSEENGTLQISQLTPDYLKPAGIFTRILPGDFNEAPALFKHHGKYFLITSGCTGWDPNPARLAVADHILGPYTKLPNPCRGPGHDTTFGAQSTHILPLPNNPNAFIFLADIWRPQNAIDGRYLWLPIQFQNGLPYLEFQTEWTLDFFAAPRPPV